MYYCISILSNLYVSFLCSFQSYRCHRHEPRERDGRRLLHQQARVWQRQEDSTECQDSFLRGDWGSGQRPPPGVGNELDSLYSSALLVLHSLSVCSLSVTSMMHVTAVWTTLLPVNVATDLFTVPSIHHTIYCSVAWCPPLLITQPLIQQHVVSSNHTTSYSVAWILSSTPNINYITWCPYLMTMVIINLFYIAWNLYNLLYIVWCPPQLTK